MDALRIFLNVRCSGSISAAAHNAHLTQSALGKRLAQLENELGITLFKRGKGQSQVRITPSGEAFTEIAERILILYEQAMELRRDEPRQYLCVASIRSAHDGLMPEVIRHWKERQPNLLVSVEDHHTAEIMPLLANRRVDIGITQSAPTSRELTGELLYEEAYRVVMRGDNAYSKGTILHPGALPVEHGVFQAFDQSFEAWFNQWWPPYSVKVRVNTTSTAERYFSESSNWMIVPAVVAHSMEQHGFCSFALEEGPPPHRVYLVYNRRNWSETAQAFAQSIREFAQRLSTSS